MSNRAWVTLATNDSYGLGALVVAHSLRRSGSVYPAVVLITPSVTDAMRERLRAVFAEVVVVDVLDSRDAAHLALLQRPELGITFTKIHCWNLTQYEKCVFLDADTLIVQNCDELFEREELSAAPDVGWPDCFNSGVFVFSPSADTFSNLITFASERGSFDGGDQGLLNSYFSDWARGDINKHLPFLYNVTSGAFYSYIPALKHYGQNLKIIHFIGAAKPWLQRYNWQSRSVDAPEHLREFLQLWWDLFVTQVHSQLDTTMDEVVEDPLPLQEESANFDEQPVNHSYYEPILDPQSKFLWHHPENQLLNAETNVPDVDVSQFHDPWDIYRGNIPASKNKTEVEPKTENYQDMRQYAWDYAHPHQDQYHNENINYGQTFDDNNHNTYHNSQHKQEILNSDFVPSLNIDHANTHFSQQQYDFHHNTNPQTHYRFNDQHTQKHNTNLESHHSHEYHYNNFNTTQDNNTGLNQSQTIESQMDYHVCTTNDNHHDHMPQVNKNPKNFTTKFKKQNRPEPVYTLMMDHIRLNRNTSAENVNGYGSDDDCDIYEEITPRHPYDGFYLRHRMTIDSHGRKICSHQIPLLPPSPPSESSEEFEDAMESFPEEITDKALNGEDNHTGVAGNLARVVPGAPLQQEAVDELTRRQGWEAGNIDYMGADSFDNIWAKISETLSQPPSSEQPQSPQEPPSEPPKEEPLSEAIPDPPSAPVTTDVAKEVVDASSEKEPEVPIPVAESVVPSIDAEVTEAPSEKTVEAPVEAKVEEAPSEEKVVPVEVPKPEEPETTEKPSEVVEVPLSKEAAIAPAEAVVESAEPEVPVPAVEASAPASETTGAPGKPEEIIPVPVEAAASELAAPVETAAPAEVKPEAAETLAAAVEELKISPEAAPETEKVTEGQSAPISIPEPTPASEVSEEPKAAAVAEKSEAVSDSPPLANTPSKEELPAAPAAKSEERRKPAGKLQLKPPLAADPALTPDSELEDAASLAQSIIASELRTPTVTSPTPPALSPALAPALDSRLSVQEPAAPTPPVGAVSLSQIGIKSKPSTAAQIESSVLEKTESAPSSPKTADAPKADAPKKKVVKKVLKKDKEGALSGEAPVPPPRKKEKKPKEK